MIIVHIGLGKTATTTLQEDVFPLLSNMRPDLIYNDGKLLQLCEKAHAFGLTPRDECEIRDIVQRSNHLVSAENLVNWDPRCWDHAAAVNKKIFGDEAVIVITIRDPVSYMRSVYQQMVHQGNIIHPEDFFIGSTDYDAVSRQVTCGKLLYFDVDAFDLERLHNIYLDRFRSVFMVPMGQISAFSFIRDSLSLSDLELRELREKFANSRTRNRAYSNFAMRLTFIRETCLNAIGARSIGSHDGDLLTYYRKLSGDGDVGEHGGAATRFSELGGFEKMTQIPFRIYRRLFSSWRGLMQDTIDRIFKYESYELPKNVYLNDIMVKKNRDYIATLTAAK